MRTLAVIVAIVILVIIGAQIYSGHRQSAVAEDAVRQRMIDRPVSAITFTKYTSSRDGAIDFACGAATWKKPDGSEEIELFVVATSGLIPSVVSTVLSSDQDSSYTRICHPELLGLPSP